MKILRLLFALCLLLVIAGCRLSPAAVPGAQGSFPAALVGTWTYTQDDSVTSYAFQANGSFMKTVQTKTVLQCGFNTSTSLNGTATVNGSALVLKATSGQLEQQEACSGATRVNDAELTTETLNWSLASSASGTELKLGTETFHKN